MKLLKEFKEFAVKGNMMDMTIGIIIGAAFNKVIDVLAKQVLLPPLSLLSDGTNFENKKIVLRDAVTNTSGEVTITEVAISYGKLFEVFLDFLIIGFTVFIVVKAMNSLRSTANDTKNKTVATPKAINLIRNIKELMEKQNKLLKASTST